MAKLKITFDQMFLLVRSEEAPVVLLPKGSGKMIHDLYVIGTEDPLLVCGADLSFCAAESKDAATAGDCTKVIRPGFTSQWPDDGWVLDVNKLQDTPPTIRAELLKNPIDSKELNARVWLPQGRFGWKWNMSDYGDARWQVGPKWNHHQWLTDIMTFESEISDRDLHFLRISIPDRPDEFIDLQVDAGDDIELTLYNRDRPPLNPDGTPDHVPFGKRTKVLKDFEVIFQLFEPTEPPLPLPKYYGPGPKSSRPPGDRTSHVILDAKPFGACDAAVASAVYEPASDTDPERPICGGAQGDPP